MRPESLTQRYAPVPGDDVAEPRRQNLMQSLGDRWYGWRNRLLADPQFHRRARRNPFMRLVARRRARQLFDLCAGFVYSQVLTSCVELDLFELLADGPRHRDWIAHQTGLGVEPTSVLLRSAVSLKLLEKRGDETYGLGIHGAAILANPGVSSMVQHHAFFYRDLKDPVSLLRREQDDTMLSMFWDYSRSESAGSSQAPYSELMHASQAMVAEQILECYPLRAYQRLLDVGGGDGTFLRSVAAAAPDLDRVLFDLPAVAEQCRQRPDDAPRPIECHGGDMFADELPSGADIISLVRVVHDHDDDQALALLKRCHAALPAGGTILLAEPMAVEDVGDPASDAYFGFYLQAMRRGRPRTPTELAGLLEKAGFVRTTQVRTHLPMLVRMLVARA